MAADRLDLLIFGATGVTGKHSIAFVQEISKSKSLTWGIAGRSETKLKELLQQKEKELGCDFSRIPIIVADVTNDESLLAMAQRTKVLLNCCGPFRSLGRPVVNACIKAGTHQVDVNGEPQYMEKLQLEKHEEAEKRGVYILSACGLDSIPCDLGIVQLQKEFDGVLNSVVTYFEEWQEGKRVPGICANYTTWASSITASANWNELKDLRKKLFTTKLPEVKPKLHKRLLPHRNDLVDGWMVPMPGPDHSVIERTQRYFYETKKKRPIQYPEIFSFGEFIKDELPSQKKLDNTLYRFTLCGEGWTNYPDDKDSKYSEPCNGRIVAQINGRNPWYGATALCMVAAGVTVLTENKKMPGKGGIYPPGAAFAETSLMQLLDQNGITFEIISRKTF